jgi:hypothetical protein
MEYPIDKVYITQEFGKNPHVYKQFGMAGHNGLDFRTRFLDSPRARRYITAALDGNVIEVTNQGRKGYGLFVRVKHGGTSQTVYAHLTRAYVQKGDSLKEGDRLGLSGNSGFSTGPHLHFGYRPDGWGDNYSNGFKGYVNPLPYLQGTHVPPAEVVDPEFAKKWAGWLIIVPELGGETWYCNPKTLKRYKLSGGVKSEDAAILARDGAWVGMTYADLTKIPEA